MGFLSGQRVGVWVLLEAFVAREGAWEKDLMDLFPFFPFLSVFGLPYVSVAVSDTMLAVVYIRNTLAFMLGSVVLTLIATPTDLPP